MERTKPQVTIVGLGLIGGSMGMALRQAQVASAVVGHDKDRAVSEQAKKMGAVDRTEWNLISACEESDLVVLAIPIGEIQDTFKALAPYLRPNCVLIDTATLKAPVLGWANEILPETVHFVGGNPIIGLGSSTGGLAAARADLFHKAVFCLVPSLKTDAEAVKLAISLVSVLGASPLFLDPFEHDGLMAAVEHLPGILELALLETVIHQPAWRELRRVAGLSFEESTRLIAADPTTFGPLWSLNRDNLIRWIDAFSSSLASIRESLVQNQAEGVSARCGEVSQERARWLHDRAEGLWEQGPQTELPERPNLLDTFLGSSWRKMRKREK